jgi:hypothetical protein
VAASAPSSTASAKVLVGFQDGPPSGKWRAAGHARGKLRFAFYGRVSTEDWQDPVTSRALAEGKPVGAGVHGAAAAGFDRREQGIGV